MKKPTNPKLKSWLFKLTKKMPYPEESQLRIRETCKDLSPALLILVIYTGFIFLINALTGLSS